MVCVHVFFLCILLCKSGALGIFVVGVSQFLWLSFVVCVCLVFYADFWREGGTVFGGSWRMVCQLAPCRRHPKTITSSKMV
jgi:hypothetical protein